MSIAYDNSTASSFSTTSVTYSHTCSGSDRILLIGAYCGADSVTAASYNGVSATFIAKLNVNGADHIYLYYLIAPATGANDVVVTITGAPGVYSSATSYTGATQSAQPDASATNVSASTTSLTTNVTTVADNSWLVGYFYGQTCSAGANTTFRAQSAAGVVGAFDSNAAKTPAGSYGLTITQATNFAGSIVASISPLAGGGGGPSPRRKTLLGVGV